jgi:hypothetical protein
MGISPASLKDGKGMVQRSKTLATAQFGSYDFAR